MATGMLVGQTNRVGASDLGGRERTRTWEGWVGGWVLRGVNAKVSLLHPYPVPVPWLPSPSAPGEMQSPHQGVCSLQRACTHGTVTHSRAG